VNYAQEARAYALMLLLALWSCELFVRLIERPPTRRREVAYVIVTALLLYAHLYGIFVIAAQHSRTLDAGIDSAARKTASSLHIHAG
jgi:uncharacterized membrane protein